VGEDEMLKVGITGGIGSGKSTVTNMLINKCFPIIDADIVAREVFIIYPEALLRIKEQFGPKFFDEQDNLNRKEFGNYIFNSDARRKQLDSIMLHFISKEIHKRIEKYEQENYKLCFIDAPTLIESKMHTSMDVIILVWVNSVVQVRRVMGRDNLNLNEVADRISSQMPIDDKRQFADYIIDNGGSIENTKLQLDVIITDIERLNVKI
jgi:dephospho-CoA kinase